MIKDALIKKLEGDIAKHEANIATYLSKPVSTVAEHIDYVATAEKKLDTLATALDKLEALKTI